MKQILYNGKIYLNRNSFASAILIENGLILKTGLDDDLLKLTNKEDIKIDLQGKTVLPGFHDSHLHLYGSAVAFQSVELYGLNSKKEIIQKAKDFLKDHPIKDKQTLIGRGWNQDHFIDDGTLLNRFDLDKISTDFPIVFSRACGHVVSVNTKALHVLGITEETHQIEGGQFDLDQNGHPNGIFRENAIGLLRPLESSLSIEDKIRLVHQISHIANKYGITSVSTNDLTLGSKEAQTLEAAYQYVSKNKPSLRVNHQVCFSDLEDFNERIQKGYHLYENEFNTYGPLKLFIDGSLGARTANMRTPYKDDPSTSGIQCMSDEEVQQFVSLADQNDISIAIHAIGDQAMTQVLDAYRKVIHKENRLRHGIIHCQITDLPLLHRFKAMDILAYVQPIFLHYDMHIVESRVGKDLASTSYAFKTMEDLKLHVSYGTDSPVEGLNVFQNIHCAIHRQDLKNDPPNGFYPLEKVDLETAIDNYTLGGAYANFQEKHLGRLLEGYKADLVILDKDIFTCDPSTIKDIQVELTMVNGVIVYQK
jgi:predicted amidohydrolase YtcJ